MSILVLSSWSPHVVQCYISCCILVVLAGLVVDVNVPLLSCWGGGERGREGDGGADCVGWGGQKRRGGNVLARLVEDEKKKGDVDCIVRSVPLGRLTIPVDLALLANSHILLKRK